MTRGVQNTTAAELAARAARRRKKNRESAQRTRQLRDQKLHDAAARTEAYRTMIRDIAAGDDRWQVLTRHCEQLGRDLDAARLEITTLRHRLQSNTPGQPTPQPAATGPSCRTRSAQVQNMATPAPALSCQPPPPEFCLEEVLQHLAGVDSPMSESVDGSTWPRWT